MKIKVYTTIDESWDYGSLNSSEKKYFNSTDLRDDYFENVLRSFYVKHFEEYNPNDFVTNYLAVNDGYIT
jgi:hypothetical protein